MIPTITALNDRPMAADPNARARARAVTWMVAVLRMLNGSALLAEHPVIAAYVARGEARPAFRRAFDAQLAVFTG